MDPLLQLESERLARSWRQYDAAMLRDYLVQDVEDPRINAQSILTRHFLIATLFGARFAGLAEQEFRFAAAMNWLLALARKSSAAELAAVLHALRRGSDNAEGLELPKFLVEAFAALPVKVGELEVPNYIESFLAGTRVEAGRARLHQASFLVFQELWQRMLDEGRATEPAPGSQATASMRKDAANATSAASAPVAVAREQAQAAPDTSNTLGAAAPRLSVLEPACGSANDYRFFAAFGLARRIDYSGFDLCEKNVANAQAMFPKARFAVGNVFAIDVADNAFDCAVVHDLFEHLSPQGLAAAVREVCRVTCRSLCVGFFNMDEIDEHEVRPVEEYHWNTLSMARTRELFARHGFTGQVLHVGSFLKWQFGAEATHNPRAYTFVLHRSRTAARPAGP
jgi:SAM-dependent methyltransferase